MLEACPFCTAVGRTFTEQMSTKDVVVSAKMLVAAPEMKEGDEELPTAKFEITEVFRGKKLVRAGMQFRTGVVGLYEVGDSFIVMGVNPPDVVWNAPLAASDRLLHYFGRLDDLPESGPERLVFFQDYFEDEEDFLAFDAYDEFARAPYKDMIAMKDQMDREKLIELIDDVDTSASRRRLYFTMLGICGKAEDTVMLEKMIVSKSKKQKRGLEALIACYLSLKGEEGVALIEKEFLDNGEAKYTDTALALQAVRFHASESTVISKERICAAVRHVLGRKDIRDMVIPDLARWEDWSVMEELVTIFRQVGEEDQFVRAPILSYLFECPLPKAKSYVEELGKLDPDSLKQARLMSGEFDFFDDSDEEEEPEDSEKEADSEKSSDASAKPAVESSSKTGSLQSSARSLRSVADYSTSDSQYVFAPVADQTNSPQWEEEPQIHRVRRVDPEADAGEETAVTASAEVLVNKDEEPVVADSVPVVVAPVAPPAPEPAVVAQASQLTWHIVFIPVVVSIVLFVLLWSVLSGKFERLIF